MFLLTETAGKGLNIIKNKDTGSLRLSAQLASLQIDRREETTFLRTVNSNPELFNPFLHVYSFTH